MKRTTRCAVVVTLVLSLAAVPLAATAEDRSLAGEAGLGVLSVVSTLVWGTGKTVFALVGGITGGLAFALTGGRKDTAMDILNPSLRGDYVVTPDHLTGKRGLVFVGREPGGQSDDYDF